MFTAEQIFREHEKLKEGLAFPDYLKEIKKLGLIRYEVFVKDNFTIYYGKNDYQTTSQALYPELQISNTVNPENFKFYLKEHQAGKVDYFEFCRKSADSGIKKWILDLEKMECYYFNSKDEIVFREEIPG